MCIRDRQYTNYNKVVHEGEKVLNISNESFHQKPVSEVNLHPINILPSNATPQQQIPLATRVLSPQAQSLLNYLNQSQQIKSQIIKTAQQPIQIQSISSQTLDQGLNHICTPNSHLQQFSNGECIKQLSFDTNSSGSQVYMKNRSQHSLSNLSQSPIRCSPSSYVVTSPINNYSLTNTSPIRSQIRMNKQQQQQPPSTQIYQHLPPLSSKSLQRKNISFKPPHQINNEQSESQQLLQKKESLSQNSPQKTNNSISSSKIFDNQSQPLPIELITNYQVVSNNARPY
eukprot:TRINITY_DN13365_c0_g1_i2.p1 TRINITY_DN13365_c0_g1~~TRINITY_DN13365_c0_g1_i2.p1  ORF type:complete len:285 (+),score=24.35 TRINITY_DN13365_c0_g1_i2:77-931(+)